MAMVGKVFTLAFWVLVVLGLAGQLGEYNQAAVYAGALILVAHIGEAIMMHTSWKEQAKPEPMDTVMVLIFGFFHLKPLIEKSKQA
jgi:uncharacterized protein YhhL (DUF1145 family)